MKVLGIHHVFFRCVVVLSPELWHADAADDVSCGAQPIEGEHPECDVKRAYALKTPEDSVNLYHNWAMTYDSSMVKARGYAMPQRLAQLFKTLVAAGRSPAGFGVTLDIGAGTGLVGQHLDGEVDAIDISADMLGQAEAKGLYRKKIVADLTKPLNMIRSATYSGFVSSATFSTGHVDSRCLPELLRIAKPGALFVLVANSRVFDEFHFGSALAGYVAAGTITQLDFRLWGYYDDSVQHDHVNETGIVIIFNRV